jgi:hypothetical protein
MNLPTDIKKLAEMMEEMAGQPREPYVRQPGERQAREIYANRSEKPAGEF